MLNLNLDSENISTKPSSPNHSIPGEAPPRFQDIPDAMNAVQFEIEYFKDFYSKGSCFVFSVKPKKKIFYNDEDKKKYVEDYKKKIKTELCKTFMMVGKCRYGSKVIF